MKASDFKKCKEKQDVYFQFWEAKLLVKFGGKFYQKDLESHNGHVFYWQIESLDSNLQCVGQMQ